MQGEAVGVSAFEELWVYISKCKKNHGKIGSTIERQAAELMVSRHYCDVYTISTSPCVWRKSYCRQTLVQNLSRCTRTRVRRHSTIEPSFNREHMHDVVNIAHTTSNSMVTRLERQSLHFPYFDPFMKSHKLFDLSFTNVTNVRGNRTRCGISTILLTRGTSSIIN